MLLSLLLAYLETGFTQTHTHTHTKAKTGKLEKQRRKNELDFEGKWIWENVKKTSLFFFCAERKIQKIFSFSHMLHHITRRYKSLNKNCKIFFTFKNKISNVIWQWSKYQINCIHWKIKKIKRKKLVLLLLLF